MVTRYVLALAVACLALGAVAGAPAAGEYAISLSNSLDVPDRTIEIDGEDYPVTSVAVRDPGASFSVAVDAPSEETYAVNVWDADGDVQASASLTGDGEANFDASDFERETGAYLVGVKADGTIRTIHPILFEAYEVTASVPSSVETGDDVTITATLDQQSDASLSGVTAVLVGPDGERTVEMSGADGEYAVEVPAEDLEPGSYTVYVAATGTETFGGTELPIGLSERHELSVVESTPTPSPTPTPTATPSPTATPTESSAGGGGGGGGGGSSAGGGQGSTPTPTPAPTPTTATPTPSPTDVSTTESSAATPTTHAETATREPTTTVSTTDGTVAASNATVTAESTDADATESSETDVTTTRTATPSTSARTSAETNDAITPRDSAATATREAPEGIATTGQHGFTLPLAVLAIALLAARRAL